MRYDGAPYQSQCEGCTFNLWHMKDAVYLNARGVSSAVLTSGRWEEVAAYVKFHGLSPALVFGAGRGGRRCWQKRGTSCVSCATVTGCPSLTPRPAGATSQPTGRCGPARHDALGRREAWRISRRLARRPRRWLAGRRTWRADLLVLALGRRRRRHIGSDGRPVRRVDPPGRPRWKPSAARAITATRVRRAGHGRHRVRTSPTARHPDSAEWWCFARACGARPCRAQVRHAHPRSASDGP